MPKMQQCTEDELQSHLLTCSALNDNSVIMNAGPLPVYEDVFCDNPQKIENIARILMKKYHLLITDNITM